MVSAAIAKREAFVCEYRIVLPDGAVRVIESRGEVVVGDDGALLRIDGTGQDITERRQAEIERQSLSTVLDASEDAITACHSDGSFSIWNRGAEKLFGYTAQEALGQPLSLVVPAAGRDAAKENVERILRGERVAPLETPLVTKDGRSVLVALTLSAIVNASGEIAGVAAIGRDITEARRAQAALADANASLVEALQAKSEFMANMNHELRTPLNGVLGVSGLLADTALDDEQREYVEALRVSGESLMAVIEDILDFSKLEAGKLALEHEPVELRALVEEVCSIVAVSQPARAVEVIAAVPAGTPAAVWGDHKRLRQVLTNLTHNAVKFTEAGEVRVDVTWGAGEDRRDRAAFRGRRHRHRHRSAAAADDLRVLLAGGRIEHAPLRRHGTGSDDRPAARRADGRRDRRPQHARGRKHVLVHAPDEHREPRHPAASPGRAPRACAR